MRMGKELGKEYSISDEAIYQFVYAQINRGGNGKVKTGAEDLRPYLARRHARRQKKASGWLNRQTESLYRQLMIDPRRLKKESSWDTLKATPFYFAHPYCSQERGSNENLNGLIRRYFPKGTDFAQVSDQEIRRVEGLLNNRPRKRFGGLTPCEVLFMKTGVALKY